MKNIFIIIFFFLFTAPAFTQYHEKNFIDQNYIEVNGTAEMEIIPNEIEITISINDKDFKTKQAFSEYEKQVVSKLKEMGIAIDNDFSVMNMNSQLKVSFLGKDNIYSTRNYKVIVHDANKANQVFSEMEKIGITTIAITHFDHSEIEKYRLQVKINAIKVAKDKASALASAIDQNIGKALFISENNFNIYQPNFNANTVFRDKLESNNIQVENVNFQKIELTYTVLVKFELK
jgi:uncharacterized protein